MSDFANTFMIVPSAGLSGIGAIPPLAFQLLTAGSATALSSSVDMGSSLVELSGLGQLLSGVSAFRKDLEAAQAAPLDSTAKAQALVDTFNGLQANLGRVQTLFGALPGAALVDQFAGALNELATQTFSGSNAGLASLPAVGITLQAATNGNPAQLNVDRNILATALATDPAGTAALLDAASRALQEQASAFESRVAGATNSLVGLTPVVGSATQSLDLSTLLGLNTSSTLQGIGVPTTALQNLAADTVLNDLQLSDLDLAAVGLDASTVGAASSVRQGALAAELAAVAVNTGNGAETTIATLLTTGTTATTVATATVAPANAPTAVGEAAVPIATLLAPTAPAATAPVTLTPAAIAGTETEAAAAERRASEATQALRDLVNDPALRAINNNLFDPAYAALIAASHLSDFVSPTPANAAATGELPEPVLPAARARAIADYTETARAELRARWQVH